MSDEQSKEDKVSQTWEPLVPEQLEQCETGDADITERKNPELERAFKDLYADHKLSEKDQFSLLYSDSDEDLSLPLEERIEPGPEKSGQSTDKPEAQVPETADIETIKQQAYDEGFSKGQSEGYQAGLHLAEEKTERLAGIVNQAEVFWQNLIKENEIRMIELIGKIAEKVVYGRVEVDNEIITRAILDIFDKIPDPVNAIITVNPDDYDYIEVVKDDFFEKIKGLKQVSVVSDQMIEPGGCRIETSAGEVDTGIEERLEAVKKSIISVAKNK